MFRRAGLFLLICLFLPIMPLASSQETESQFIPVPGLAPRVALSPDGKWLAAFDWMPVYQIREQFPSESDLMLRLVNLETSEVFELGRSEFFIFSAAFSPDSSQLASSHTDGVIMIWDVNSRTLIRQFPSVFNGGWLSYLDETTLILTNYHDSYSIIDTETGYTTGYLRPTLDFSSQDFGVALQEVNDRLMGFAAVSLDGSRIVSVAESGRIWVWEGDIPNNEARLLSSPSEEEIQATSVPIGFSIRDFTFLADNRTVGFVGGDGVSLLDTQTGDRQFIGAIDSPFAISPDDSQIVWANRDEDTVMIASLENAQNGSRLLFEKPTTIGNEPTQIFFTPNGKQLILAGFRSDNPADNGIVIVNIP